MDRPRTMRECLDVMCQDGRDLEKWQALAMFLGELAEVQGVDLELDMETHEPVRKPGAEKPARKGLFSWWGPGKARADESCGIGG